MGLQSTQRDKAAVPLSVPDAIRRRRAIRRFDPALPVTAGVLREVLSLATLAPSGFNLQPWRFLVVRDERNRQKLRTCAFNQPKITDAPAVVIVLGYHHPHRSHLEAMLSIQQAEGAITPTQAAEFRARAFGAMERVSDRPLWATRSSMLAAATMMLAAESLGLSSAPMEGFDPQAVKDAFGIPDDHTVCCLVALVHDAEPKPFPGRFSLDEVCYAEHFGRPWTAEESTTA
jgi:nitroreductase